MDALAYLYTTDPQSWDAIQATLVCDRIELHDAMAATGETLLLAARALIRERSVPYADALRAYEEAQAAYRALRKKAAGEDGRTRHGRELWRRVDDARLIVGRCEFSLAKAMKEAGANAT